MKPATAAKKLGIYLPATPEEFQRSEITRSALLELENSPPEWLETLRRDGPHPRQVVAHKLGVSTSGLARAGAPDVLTTAEIKELLTSMPEWLVIERATQAGVHEENARIKADRAVKAQGRTGVQNR
jgi:acetaldehyde dehydrogenase (acetylating)